MDRCREYIMPYLLCFFLNASIIGIYGEGMFSIFNIASAVIMLAMFFFLGFLNRHKIVGGLIYVILAFSCLMLMMYFIFKGGFFAFESWFLTAGERSPSQPEFFWALVSVFPFFLSSVVYYFTLCLYRTTFLMLGSLVPCALYVKTLTEMSDFYLVCIAGLNGALFVYNVCRKKDGEKRGAAFGKNAGYVSVTVLTCAAMLIASIIPKQGEAIYYDVFEYYFMDSNTSSRGMSGSLSNRSGNAGFFRDLDSTPLYNVTADDLIYYRKQNFDIYSLDEHCWYPLEKYSEKTVGVNESLSERAALDLDSMLAAIKRGAELDGQIKAAVSPSLLALDSVGEQSGTAVITPAGYAADFYLTSVRTKELRAMIPENNIGITLHKQAGSSASPSAQPYGIDYLKEFGSRSVWTENGGADFTNEEYSEFIQRLYDVLERSGEEEYAETANAFLQDHLFAEQYRSDCADNLSEIPDRIKELAEELTAGYSYDYQKAAVLQEYFQDNGGFRYDLDYIPPMGRNTAEYFIFNSKRGTCSDFATAFTLMARAAGLTVRYTEGFSPDITSNENQYVIRASGSHAYPEVYIQDLGWTVFEPTVSGAYAINSGNAAAAAGGIAIDTEILMNVILVLCVISAAAVIVIFAVPAVSYLADEMKINRGGAESVILIYKRISGKIGRKFKIRSELLTPSELSCTVKEKLDTDISPLVEIYEETVFGETSPSAESCEKCHFIYNEFGKAFGEKRKKRKGITV